MLRFILLIILWLTVLFITIIFLPILLLISIFILLFDGAPVLFQQDRIGKNNKIFKMYKFRTMVNEVGNIPKSEITNPDSFITLSGGFLRKFSLDELPQLFNVLNGSMNLIGYRPCLSNERRVINERKKYKLETFKPGITGWAQINGRDNISIEEKVYLDAFYFKNRSVYLDLKILAKTILHVILKKDVSH